MPDEKQDASPSNSVLQEQLRSMKEIMETKLNAIVHTLEELQKSFVSADQRIRNAELAAEIKVKEYDHAHTIVHKELEARVVALEKVVTEYLPQVQDMLAERKDSRRRVIDFIWKFALGVISAALGGYLFIDKVIT